MSLTYGFANVCSVCSFKVLEQFLAFERVGSTLYSKTLPISVESECPRIYIGGWTHSVFIASWVLHQVSHWLGSQIHTMHSEAYALLLPWLSIPHVTTFSTFTLAWYIATKITTILFWWSKRYLITMLRYYSCSYIAKVHPNLFLFPCSSYLNTSWISNVSYHIGGIFLTLYIGVGCPIIFSCWCIPYLDPFRNNYSLKALPTFTLCQLLAKMDPSLLYCRRSSPKTEHLRALKQNRVLDHAKTQNFLS